VVAIGAAAMTPPIAAFFIFQKLIFGRHPFLSFLLFFLVIIFLSLRNIDAASWKR
jgi:hypothetical protein